MALHTFWPACSCAHVLSCAHWPLMACLCFVYDTTTGWVQLMVYTLEAATLSTQPAEYILYTIGMMPRCHPPMHSTPCPFTAGHAMQGLSPATCTTLQHAHMQAAASQLLRHSTQPPAACSSRPHRQSFSLHAPLLLPDCGVAAAAACVCSHTRQARHYTRPMLLAFRSTPQSADGVCADAGRGVHAAAQ